MNDLNQEYKDNVQKGILDAVSFSQQSSTMRSMNPQGLVLELLEKLKPREKDVLIKRYGLEDGEPVTLEKIGKMLNLTRERIRQIEREALRKLGTVSPPQDFVIATDLIYQIIEEHGGILSENTLLEVVLVNKETPQNKMAILFTLSAVPRFSLYAESAKHNRAWYVNGFDRDLLEKVVEKAKDILDEVKKPLRADALFDKITQKLGPAEGDKLTSEALESYITVSKELAKSPFQEWGKASWPEIRPKDVGDKAFLVLTHHSKPEHYSVITELINKAGFDQRIAHKETVHNELIKDKRFVLIGRGIYALRDWGYKEGDVADVIEDILKQSDMPLSKDEIIDRVLKQRMVKKNTIVFGLLNKNRFTKTPDNKYILPTKD